VRKEAARGGGYISGGKGEYIEGNSPRISPEKKGKAGALQYKLAGGLIAATRHANPSMGRTRKTVGRNSRVDGRDLWHTDSMSEGGGGGGRYVKGWGIAGKSIRTIKEEAMKLKESAVVGKRRPREFHK